MLTPIWVNVDEKKNKSKIKLKRKFYQISKMSSLIDHAKPLLKFETNIGQYFVRKFVPQTDGQWTDDVTDGQQG